MIFYDQKPDRSIKVVFISKGKKKVDTIDLLQIIGYGQQNRGKKGDNIIV